MDISALPSERFEAEIILGAAQSQAATYRWLLLVAEFERRGLYATWGARSTAHRLNFACGISLRTAHDHVRVATRLAELPQVAEAFAGGVISYSKVRAISRIATPESEPALLEAARSASASQLERLAACREAVTRNEAQEVEAKRQFFLHENHDDGYSVSGNLSAEEGAAVRAAMAAHKAGLEAAARGEGDGSPCSAEHTPEVVTDHDQFLCSAEHRPPRPGSADVFMSIITTALAAGPTATEDGEPVQVVLHIEEQNEQLGLHITASTSNLLGYTYRPNYDEAIQALLDAERSRVNS